LVSLPESDIFHQLFKGTAFYIKVVEMMIKNKKAVRKHGSM
jgi:hypothetical protein